MIVRHLICSFALFAAAMLVSFTAMASEQGLKTQFIGGTLAGVPSQSAARLDLTGPESLQFTAGKTALSIPYRRIGTLEYGQSVRRRVAEAVLISPLLLLSKSRKHFVTIGYEDTEGQRQALVFRVDKDSIRTVMAGLEARTGRRFTFLDGDARQAAGQ